MQFRDIAKCLPKIRINENMIRLKDSFLSKNRYKYLVKKGGRKYIYVLLFTQSFQQSHLPNSQTPLESGFLF